MATSLDTRAFFGTYLVRLPTSGLLDHLVDLTVKYRAGTSNWQNHVGVCRLPKCIAAILLTAAHGDVLRLVSIRLHRTTLKEIARIHQQAGSLHGRHSNN
jgi:hypothetical protein